ncbi:aminomethyltransferase [Crossiella equi]|uniref:Aminomethyltransferase n=1 Tax=Crossiella equi TaxID=130796 RepID=A0ABS5ACR3_9PSEU|nr:glycine cleavage system aminomethyltransferase GcvT [Crossiella equi]MBP2474359.1 aminomethyltransferase [Crossiella equi]
MTAAGGASRRSPLHAEHVRLGAQFTDFAGWSMPLRYGSELAEHKVVREAAGLFDLSHMGEIQVSGPEAGRVLDYALVGSIGALAVGRARYTMLVHTNGGVLDDLVVYRRAEREFLVVANASNAAVVRALLSERAHGLDALVLDLSASTALIAVQGPVSAEIVTTVTGQDLTDLKYYAGRPAAIAGHEVFLARTGYTGEDGFEVYVAAEHAGTVWQRIEEAGTPLGLKPAGLACRDTLRLEAGMPLYGNELHVGVTPFDAGLGRVVRFDKLGDFVGRKALESRTETTRALVGLVTDGRRSPRAGHKVHGADGAVIGEVTSGALSPTLGHPVAIAYLDHAHTAAGTEVLVDVRGTSEPARVVALPFYKRSR